jgi:hypothetical protein
MAEAFFNNGVINSGGGLSLAAGDNLPAAGIFGRFYYDFDAGIFYFDDGSNWQTIGGGGGSPDLQNVLNAGNSAYNIGMSLIGNNSFYRVIAEKDVKNVFPNFGLSVEGITRFQAFNNSINQIVLHSYNEYSLVSENGINNVNLFYDVFNQYTKTQFVNLINSQITYTGQNFVQNGAQFQFSTDTSADLIFSNNLISFYVDQDIPGGPVNSLVDINNRYGIYLEVLANGLFSYNDVWGIYDVGNKHYFGGYMRVGYNPGAITYFSATFGAPIRFETNAISPTAGGNSGQHLIVYIDTVPYKIQLLNN